ncbi:MAG: YihY/virulence factor BrkB family protein [Saprospiraceae bacterium]
MKKINRLPRRNRNRAPNITRLKRLLLTSPPISTVIRWSKTHSLPGFVGIPVFDVIDFLFEETRRFDLFTRANSIAYSFFISLFPSLMSLFTLLPYLRNYILRWFLPNEAEENFDIRLIQEIQEFLPGVAGVEIAKFIEDLITNPRVGLLSLGFILAIFFASNGMMSMMLGFEKAYPRTFKKRTGLRKRLIAIFLTFQLGIFLIASVVFIILGNWLISILTDLVGLSRFTEISLYLVRWIIIIMLLGIVISIIYRYGVPTHRKFRLFSPGAILATVLSLLTSIGFSFYVDNFGNYNKLYGSFGTIIVTMLWIQLNSLVLLLGFELNASIAINRDLREQILEKKTTPAEVSQ